MGAWMEFWKRGGRRLALLAVATVVFGGGACQTVPDSDGSPDVDEEQVATEGADSATTQSEAPKRIIFFIGDGMSISGPTAASYASERDLAMLDMAEFGLMSTHNYEFVTTDSAASATAMATGEKTHFEGVSVTPGTGVDEAEDEDHQLRHIVQAASEAGWRSGLTATVRMTHATPAPFGAHRHHRHQYDDIARDLRYSGVDVLLGPGYEYFRDREDERDLMEEMADDGYAVSDDAEQVRDIVGDVSRLVGLVHERDMPWYDEGQRAMDLEEMVDRSIETLDRGDPEGFFLMVEGAKIDWAGHAMDGERLVSETLDMDRAVERALEYAGERDDTLVVVSADHETGGMDVLDGTTADRFIGEDLENDDELRAKTSPDDLDAEERRELAGPFARLERRDAGVEPDSDSSSDVVTSFGYLSAASRAYWDGSGRFSAMHTPELVPIFAEGPGAREVTQLRDNADLGRQFLAWMDGETPDVERAGEESPTDDGQPPENTALFVADGLGINSLTASYYHSGPPTMLDMDRLGAVSTHPDDGLVNDVPGAATALFDGTRTQRDALGMTDDAGETIDAESSVLKRARESGKKIGVVTTSSLLDASPGILFDQQREYGDRQAIAQGFVDFHDSGDTVDFVAAGGADEVGEERIAKLEAAGVDVHRDWSGVERDTDGPTHVLMDDVDVSIEEMTERAIAELSDGDQGYLLIVDSGDIGEAKRDFAVGSRVMDAIDDFDAAVDVARGDTDTLVLATSYRDHSLSVTDNHYAFRGDDRCGAAVECGGDFELQWLDVAADAIRHGEGLGPNELRAPEYSPPQIALQYTWLAQQADHDSPVQAPHSANFVPLIAEGPGAGRFSGFVDQPQIGQWLLDWAGGDGAQR